MNFLGRAIWIASLAFAIALIGHAAFAAPWSRAAGPISAPKCGNYCPIDGSSYASNDGAGTQGTFQYNGRVALSRSALASFGVKSFDGRVLDWVRTIGLDNSRAILHMSAGGYGAGYSIPVYAERVAGAWKLRGAIRIGGAVKRTYSSSMAYQFRDGVHWMIQDSDLAQGGLRAFRSTDGINYTAVGGNIAAVVGAVQGSWPDMEYHAGRYHLVFTYPRWDSTRIAHLSAVTPAGPWRIENKIAMYQFKSVNLFEKDSRLWAYSTGKFWRLSGTASASSDGGGTSGGGDPCTAPVASLSGRDLSTSWAGDGVECIRKLRDLTRSKDVDFARDRDGKHVYAGLPDGRYRFLIRRAVSGAPYSAAPDVTVSGGSTSSGAPCTSPSVSVSGRDAAARWVAGSCQIKLAKSGSTVDYRSLTGGQWVYRALAAGTYLFRVRRSGGTYQDARFSIP